MGEEEEEVSTESFTARTRVSVPVSVSVHYVNTIREKAEQSREILTTIIDTINLINIISSL